jgi:hypothetical protein
MQEKKCKVLEIIPYDLDENHCEIIASLCLWMLFDVAMRNVTTSGDDQVLCITGSVQIVDIDVSDEDDFRGSKGEDNSHALTMNEILAPPLPIHNDRPGHVRMEKRSARLSIARIKVPKKKMKKKIPC